MGQDIKKFERLKKNIWKVNITTTISDFKSE